MPAEEMEFIEVMTAERWKERYIQEARTEARVRQNRWNEKHIADRERREYFCRQKFYGIIGVMFILFLTVLTENLVCAVLVIPAIVIIFTKKMVLVNEYYWTHGGAEQWKRM